jgi:hypothetical protein
VTAPVLYLVMRNDLPSLNPGKLAAQAAHVANVAVKNANPKIRKEWESQTKQHFGTTIVLGADRKFLMTRMGMTLVWDPTYPCEIPFEVGAHLVEEMLRENVYLDHDRRRATYLRNEVVGAWALGDRPDIFDGLELYP